MLVRHSNWLPLVLALGMAGCSGGKTDTPSATSGGSAALPAVHPKGPQDCVQMFLEAVRKGDDKTSSALLTDIARKKTQEMNLQVAPPGSATASYEIGEVKAVGEQGSDEGAYVASRWTDVGDDGKPHTDEIMWMVTKDPEGWRIVGMGVKVFEDLDPVYLNFEDPQDMLRKQQLVEQEMKRRAGVLDPNQGVAGAPPGNSPGASNAIAVPGQNPGSSLPPTGGPPAQAQLPASGNPPQLK